MLGIRCGHLGQFMYNPCYPATQAVASAIRRPVHYSLHHVVRHLMGRGRPERAVTPPMHSHLLSTSNATGSCVRMPGALQSGPGIPAVATPISVARGMTALKAAALLAGVVGTGALVAAIASQAVLSPNGSTAGSIAAMHQEALYTHRR